MGSSTTELVLEHLLAIANKSENGEVVELLPAIEYLYRQIDTDDHSPSVLTTARVALLQLSSVLTAWQREGGERAELSPANADALHAAWCNLCTAAAQAPDRINTDLLHIEHQSQVRRACVLAHAEHSSNMQDVIHAYMYDGLDEQQQQSLPQQIRDEARQLVMEFRLGHWPSGNNRMLLGSLWDMHRRMTAALQPHAPDILTLSSPPAAAARPLTAPAARAPARTPAQQKSAPRSQPPLAQKTPQSRGGTRVERHQDLPPLEDGAAAMPYLSPQLRAATQRLRAAVGDNPADESLAMAAGVLAGLGGAAAVRAAAADLPPLESSPPPAALVAQYREAIVSPSRSIERLRAAERLEQREKNKKEGEDDKDGNKGSKAETPQKRPRRQHIKYTTEETEFIRDEVTRYTRAGKGPRWVRILQRGKSKGVLNPRRTNGDIADKWDNMKHKPNCWSTRQDLEPLSDEELADAANEQEGDANGEQQPDGGRVGQEGGEAPAAAELGSEEEDHGGTTPKATPKRTPGSRHKYRGRPPIPQRPNIMQLLERRVQSPELGVAQGEQLPDTYAEPEPAGESQPAQQLVPPTQAVVVDDAMDAQAGDAEVPPTQVAVAGNAPLVAPKAGRQRRTLQDEELAAAGERPGKRVRRYLPRTLRSGRTLPSMGEVNDKEDDALDEEGDKDEEDNEDRTNGVHQGGAEAGDDDDDDDDDEDEDEDDDEGEESQDTQDVPPVAAPPVAAPPVAAPPVAAPPVALSPAAASGNRPKRQYRRWDTESELALVMLVGKYGTCWREVLHAANRLAFPGLAGRKWEHLFDKWRSLVENKGMTLEQAADMYEKEVFRHRAV